jgi:hypothetical protein
MKLEDDLSNLGTAMTAIKATGGHKFLDRMKLSTPEAERLAGNAELNVRRLVAYLRAAESVIDTWGKKAEYDSAKRALCDRFNIPMTENGTLVE